MREIGKCELCGEPLPAGEEMFKYHGYSGNCPKPPLPKLTKPTYEELERSIALKDAELEALKKDAERLQPLLKVAEAAIRQHERKSPPATYHENEKGYGWYSELELAIDAAIHENEGRK